MSNSVLMSTLALPVAYRVSLPIDWYSISEVSIIRTISVVQLLLPRVASRVANLAPQVNLGDAIQLSG